MYRPFTKLTLTLDGVGTAQKIRGALRAALAPRMGPVHVALPSDVARAGERETDEASGDLDIDPIGPATDEAVDLVAAELGSARRPVLILGLDLDPRAHARAVREFVETIGVPTLVTPKAKGLLPEEHPLFFGVCAGVAGDGVIVDFIGRADLLVGIGFDPVESDKLWHQTQKLVAIGPVSIAADDYRPHAEAVGDIERTLAALRQRKLGPFDWPAAELQEFRADLLRVLRPAHRPRGLSPYELTHRLRELFPRDTVLVTDVGSVKSVTTQAWTTYEPLTFFESNGLSAMSYSMAGAMAARLQFPDRPILCTVGDGGLGMTLTELETCVREHLHFVTIVYNDSSLSLIQVAQENRGYPTHGVRYGDVDFAAVAAAMGAWARRVRSLDELDAAVRERPLDCPVVIDAIVDPTEYRAHNSPFTRGVA